MVRQHIVDLLSDYDVTKYDIKRESKLAHGKLIKIRNNDKSRLCVQVKGCVLVDTLVAKNRDMALLLQPVGPLVNFILALEKQCIMRAHTKRLEWLDDANASVDDMFVECIKYHGKYGKVACLRIKPEEKLDLCGINTGDMMDCVLGIEGLYIRQGRIDIMWTLDHAEAVERFKWNVDAIQTVDDRDGDDVAEPDNDDIDEMRAEIENALILRHSEMLDMQTKCQECIEKIDMMMLRLHDCGNNLSELEEIREEFEALV